MDEKRESKEHQPAPKHTVDVNGEKLPRNGPASDGAIGGGGGVGGGQSSLTAAGNEKIPPRR
jgi:hypothetical protein